MLLGLLHSGLAVVLRLETLSLTLYTVVVVLLLKQHLAATRPWASEVPADSELLLLKQHLDIAATRLSASVTAVHADSVVELRKQHLAATRPWASEVPTNSVLLLLKQHSDMVTTRLSASAVPTNPILALL
ncbi:hypothetical protein PF002_g32735 [Phytophthora fragariae]|uniref:Uncharacterized protein n=1 Tax=Phytophthora fragariae TaxID=53985 RepID=A0A6A4AYX2_9STRA|nr:hypothetical protein PF006_g32712 [Phytophthora fragariae]KAE9159991.1 hypothetical protein PF002_g32735 [Phytophthora fragariae]KAE9263551.1 hypothetical protein PF001_g31625 [Phytophthora fragariae]